MPHTRPRLMLGDVLLKRNQLSEHQLGVALDVQRRTKLPIGEILVGANILSPRRLKMALLWQKLLRWFAITPKQNRSQLYGAALPHLARERFEQHIKTFPLVPVVSYEIAETMKLRRERSQLNQSASRIVDESNLLQQKLLTGNF